jgi:two-component system chemotaxis response regulator CheY
MRAAQVALPRKECQRSSILVPRCEVLMAGHRVLIVDDDQLIRMAVRDALADEPLDLSEAADGEEALAMIAAQKPALVLLDLLMPKKSGLEVLPEVSKLSPETRVVVMSSMETESMVDFALAMGARAFVPKPFHPLEIIAAVRDALAE